MDSLGSPFQPKPDQRSREHGDDNARLGNVVSWPGLAVDVVLDGLVDSIIHARKMCLERVAKEDRPRSRRRKKGHRDRGAKQRSRSTSRPTDEDSHNNSFSDNFVKSDSSQGGRILGPELPVNLGLELPADLGKASTKEDIVFKSDHVTPETEPELPLCIVPAKDVSDDLLDVVEESVSWMWPEWCFQQIPSYIETSCGALVDDLVLFHLKEKAKGVIQFGGRRELDLRRAEWKEFTPA